MKRSARVIVASNRAAGGVYADTTGPVIAGWLAERAFDVPEPLVVPDGEPVGKALRQCLNDEVDVIVTTGGTGISPTDRTPEETSAVLDYQLAGLADAIRSAGLPKVPTAVLSRGLAGVAGRTLVVNLPGSRGGVQDGLGVLDGVLSHALDQLAGEDHPRPGAHDQTADATASHDGHAGDDGYVDVAGDSHAAARSGHAHPAATAGGSTSSHPVAARIALAQVTEQPISVDAHAELVDDPAAGGVVTFGGVVRDHDGGRSVLNLFYEGHPTASDVLARVVADVAGRRAGVRAVAVSHRLGALTIGDVALACAVSADHRGEAFATCAELVDEVKARLPVWKHQHFADGTDEWVNSP